MPARPAAALLQVINTASGGINVAAATAGGVASASSVFSSQFPVAALNNNERKGAGWGSGGGWNDGTANAFPDWVEIDFNGNKIIDRVIVYTLQDNYPNSIEPTDSLTFSQYGVTDFTVQGWNGAAWVTLGSVSGNNLVKRAVTFPAFTTTRIRVNVTSALMQYSRLVEVEAWGMPRRSAAVEHDAGELVESVDRRHSGHLHRHRHRHHSDRQRRLYRRRQCASPVAVPSP